MSRILLSLGILLFFMSHSIELQAQFYGSNLAEYQFGKLPNDTSSRSTLYDRLVVNYNYKSLKASATIEQFHTPLAGSKYINLSQFSLQFKLKPFEFKVGNFYETIGRGLLLRSFEIPGAILEDLSYRSRHYFNRDVLGVSARYNYKNFNTKILYGSPLNYVFPPTQAFRDRRSDTIAAIYSDYSFKNHTIGAAVMKHTNSGNDRAYLMASASGNFAEAFSYYTEFAKNVSDFSVSDFSTQSSYAFYTGLNYTRNSFGLSVEYKNYNNFLIGSGINEPPALIKEHAYKVLNRSTHVLQPLNETGYQIEIFYSFPNLSTLTFNNTMAINNFGRKFVFHEFFLEYDFSVAEKLDIKIFADYAEDPFKLEEHRVSTGISTDWKIFGNSSMKFNYEFQTFERLSQNIQNHVFVLGYAYKSKIICNLVTEYSDDSFVVTESSKIWVGANLKYQINNKHALQVFAGERRGGPACNAGVCYEVLDFKGVELRITSRF